MWDEDDALSHLLDPLRLRGAYVSDWRLRSGWGVQGDPEPRALLHYMLDGTGTILLPGEAPRTLGPGELAIFPRGAAHVICEDIKATPRTIAELLPDRTPGDVGRLELGEGPAVGRMLCAGLDYTPDTEYPVYRTLPDVLILRAAEIEAQPPMAHALGGLMAEFETRGSGTQAVLLRNFEMVFVLGLRATLMAMEPPVPMSRALAHPSIGRALIAIYEDYARPWTVPALADVAKMSRSSFTRTFKDIVGESPGRHLKRHRLSEARRLLGSTQDPHDVIARKVGYQSAVGLHLAFREEYGAAPGAVRRTRLVEQARVVEQRGRSVVETT